MQAEQQVTSAKIRTISAQVEKRLRQQVQEYEATMTLQSMKHQSKLSKQQSNFSSDMDDAMGKILALTGEVRDNDALIQELKKAMKDTVKEGDRKVQSICQEHWEKTRASWERN